MAISAGDVVSVILHFRTPISTLACLRALANEGVQRTVLVDNSEDGGVSLAAMNDGLDELRACGMDVEVLTPQYNLGFAKAANLALRRVLELSAEAALLINSDAQLERGSLKPLLVDLGRADVVLPRVRSTPDLPPVSSIGYYQCATALLIRIPCLRCVEYPSGCCMLLRTSLLQEPLFDETLFFYGEDVLLGNKLRCRGIKICSCDNAVVLHQGSGSAKNGSMFYEYHVNRSHLIIARKLASTKLEYVCYVACRCLTLSARAIVRSARSCSLTPWRGLVAAARDVMNGRCRSFTPIDRRASSHLDVW